jgi:UDP-N-acetylmuramoylalanine--D-glutamate ligase
MMSSIDKSKVQQERAWWRDKKVAIWGAGLSGISAAKLLIKLGAEVTLSDSKPLVELPLAHHLPSQIKTSFGRVNRLHDADVLIPSPGFKPSHPILANVLNSNVRVMSEIELGARVTEARLIAITGTDGKSTTTKLISEGLAAQSVWTKAVGNIGDPICNWALEAPHDSFLIVEVSAFQLWSTQYLNAEIGVITNIAEDHYDYFDGSIQAYRHAKLRLGQLLTPNGTLFYPKDQLNPEEIQPRADSGSSILNLVGYQTPTTPVSTPLLGDHNQRNINVALQIIKRLGFDEALAINSYQSFIPLPYRMTLSLALNGIQYINDSKATNVHAACTGLESVHTPLIVITGGYDKGLTLIPLLECLKSRAKAVLCIGQTGLKIHQALLNSDVYSTYSGTLDVAVMAAYQRAQSGDIVILSPAASSFDQFKNFEDRGAIFDTLVSSIVT